MCIICTPNLYCSILAIVLTSFCRRSDCEFRRRNSRAFAWNDNRYSVNRRSMQFISSRFRMGNPKPESFLEQFAQEKWRSNDGLARHSELLVFLVLVISAFWHADSVLPNETTNFYAFEMFAYYKFV